MERVGFMFKLKEGMAEECTARHCAVWEELKKHTLSKKANP